MEGGGGAVLLSYILIPYHSHYDTNIATRWNDDDITVDVHWNALRLRYSWAWLVSSTRARVSTPSITLLDSFRSPQSGTDYRLQPDSPSCQIVLTIAIIYLLVLHFAEK